MSNAAEIKEKAIAAHKEWNGKLEIHSKIKVDSSDALSIAYTPGVAEPCKEIAKNKELVYDYTIKKNTIAVVTDGTAVLGLGDIGPEAALPVMEGKAILFKEFAGINAFPICLDTKDTEEIIRTVKLIAPAFGGINLEDISAPRCFEIEERLKKELNIPVFHDDQHGTAIVVLAAVINANRLTKKSPDIMKVVINGAGSAGISITKLLIKYGFKNILLCDRSGILYSGYPNINPAQAAMLKYCNLTDISGNLADALCGADLFIGVSAGNCVTREMVNKMNKNAAVFAMANPTPEITPEEAKAGGVSIIGTGRSDYPNQINNVLAFPGIFKGALQCRTQITDEMKLAAAKAIAGMIPDEELNAENIMPKPFRPGVADAVAAAIIKEANKK
ncbi:MAG: hypothetical protein K0S55_1166 [Clostridia bacterium]|nr:hypothetical protein [Clostridia bacterium]